MSQLYDEIVVNEIKIEGGAEELEAASSPQPPRSPARPGLEGGRQRRRSLSDMFDTAPVRSRASAHGDGAPVCCSVFGPQPLPCRLLAGLEAAVTRVSMQVLSVEEQKKGFEELGQKMYDCQQRGIKGAPKKVQVGVTGLGITIFDMKGRPVSVLSFWVIAGCVGVLRATYRAQTLGAVQSYRL